VLRAMNGHRGLLTRARMLPVLIVVLIAST